MHMAVTEIFRVIFVHQTDEARKALMRKVLAVVELEGRRMGQKNIKPLMGSSGEKRSLRMRAFISLCVY